MLASWLDTLTDEQIEQYPDCGDVATDIYLEASLALEGK